MNIFLLKKKIIKIEFGNKIKKIKEHDEEREFACTHIIYLYLFYIIFNVRFILYNYA